VAYQVVAGERVTVEARYALGVGNRVGLELGRYDATQPLIINPVLYSTYLGGCSLDLSSDIAVDQAGNAYVTGYTNSVDFPVHPPNNRFQGGYDAFVSKLSSNARSGMLSLAYSTYLGGSGDDYGTDIAVDQAGNAYVTGYTNSADFSVHPPNNRFQGPYDAFVAKIGLADQ
jgi:Beta-propeller repeat